MAIALLFFFITTIAFLVLWLMERKNSTNARNAVQQSQQQAQAAWQAAKDANQKLQSMGYNEYQQVQQAIDVGSQTIQENNKIIASLRQQITELTETQEKLVKQNRTASNKLAKQKELYQSVTYTIDRYMEADVPISHCRLPQHDADTYDELSPSVILKLHAMDIKSLRKAFRDNDKLIEQVMEQYSKRYTTKANQTIYKLMVIALRAELQNILYDLKYEKLDNAIEKVKNMTSKYLVIASEGNQNIAGTLTRFIGEIEYLFINAVKIEYNYYVKREQAKQEQAAIREQMRQEAAERKALEAERKKIEAEESKYQAEMERVRQQLESASEADAESLNQRILELESMLADVLVKKDDIVTLQNGKAGTVYIISNLGSFGDNMFKVGMTRRLNPQDRVDELGDASVPFRFDVHSFIFSEDAVGLEKKLHDTLNLKRVNKVNLRKEFFYATIDEMEALVTEIDPTAEFNKTMLAEEFRQSLSSEENYVAENTLEEDEEG